VHTTVEEGDVVIATQGLGGDVTTEEDGAAEDEETHNAQPISCA
jgi:hypothetical protein